MQCVMDHIVLNIEDDDKMIDFYAHVLKLDTERVGEYRAGKVPFPSVRLNPETIIDLFPKKLWQEGASRQKGWKNLNHFCLSLRKPVWDELVQRLQDNGVAVETGPAARWGARGTGTSIYFRDPEGNLIEARYYAARTGEDPCLLGS